MKDVLKRYPPTSNKVLTCSVISSMKDRISSLESEIFFLRGEIKEKNKLISSLISLSSTECTAKQPFLVTNSYKNNSEGNMESHCSNNG